ncbi:MAG: CHASE domain-containing protein, partial [Proteobacteria bacterium]|nr:CHASE domain-containing protein [Pseudomonadota bacterium]
MQSTDDTPNKQSRKFIMARYGLIGFMAAVGIILSYASFKVTRNWEEDRSLEHLRELTRNHGVAIEIGLLTHLDFLHSIAALYATSPFVSREEFRTFANSLLKRAPGVQALEWIPRISAGEREKYERIARADGFPDFRIKEKNAKGNMVPAGTRAEYFPVYYVEPLKGNERALGFDLASNATRRDALTKARETGKVVVSGRIKLVQETGDQFAFLAFKPIYQKNYPLHSVELRRKFLLGFALGVFRIGDVVENALAKQVGPSGLDIYVFDDSAPAGNRFLYFHPSRVRQTKVPPESEETIFTGPHLTFNFPVGDRVWTLVFKPVAGYFAENSTWVPWSALFVGLVFTSILTVYLVSAADRERRITNLVHERTGALKESDARFRGAIESLQESFALYDSDDRLSIYNDEFVRLHAGVQDIIRPGMPYEELIRESVKRGKIADAIGREEEFIRDRIVQHRNPSDMVLRELTDGTWYIINEARTPEGGIAVTQTDVTELKDAEKALRESEGRLKSIIDTVPALINVKSIEGRYLLTNRLHSDFFGVEPGAWIGKTSDAISKKHGERVRELDRAIVKTGESVPPYDYRMVDAEGRERDFLTAKNPLRDLSGEIIGIVSTSIDITERKQMEQDFRESEERIRAVVDNVIDGIITIDERGTIHSANPAAERIFEYAEEDLIGQNVNTLAAEPYRSAHDSYLANYLTSGEKKIIGKVRELVGQRRNGQHFPLELAVSELQVGGQRMFVGIVRDITARKEIERIKGEFVSP